MQLWQEINKSRGLDSGLGLDFGTSGARAAVLTRWGEVIARAAVPYAGAADDPASWRAALFELLEAIPLGVRRRVQAIVVDGTSGTVLLADRQGTVLEPPLMYHDGRGAAVMDEVEAIAPAQSAARSPTSALAKLLWWRRERFGGAWPTGDEAPRLFHQADWLAFLLHGRLARRGVAWTDYHNALKLGGDPATRDYPAAWAKLDFYRSLPKIAYSGMVIDPILPAWQERFEFGEACYVLAGITDSNAAFFASDARDPGQALTSLGSTMALKLLCERRIDAPELGIYSHRWPGQDPLWIVGGASNCGGAVLAQFFRPEAIAQLSQAIDPSRPSPLDYYPLPSIGERFPIADPHLAPRLYPRPDDPVALLHGLLEGLARVEALGYERLQELGADPLVRVETAGGGAANATWAAIRARHLGVPVVQARHSDAAVGAAWLALKGSLW